MEQGTWGQWLIQRHGQGLMDRWVAIVLVNVDLGPAQSFPAGFHCILTWPKPNILCWASSCEIHSRSSVIVRLFLAAVFLGPQRMGVLWYFAASLGPCCQGADLIFHSPSVIGCRAISGPLQNHLRLSPRTLPVLSFKYTAWLLGRKLILAQGTAPGHFSIAARNRPRPGYPKSLQVSGFDELLGQGMIRTGGSGVWVDLF